MGRLYYPIEVSPDLRVISIIMTIFRIFLSIIGFDESDKLCWKHNIFLFYKRKKGIYINDSMSASQYRSVENTETCVHIFASWLQLIYILWVFYVSILSICHKFIDSSISIGLTLRNFFNICKAIISIDFSPGVIRPIGLIPSNFSGCL